MKCGFQVKCMITKYCSIHSIQARIGSDHDLSCVHIKRKTVLHGCWSYLRKLPTPQHDSSTSVHVMFDYYKNDVVNI